MMNHKNVPGVTDLTKLIPYYSLQIQNLHLFCQNLGIMKLRIENWELLKLQINEYW